MYSTITRTLSYLIYVQSEDPRYRRKMSIGQPMHPPWPPGELLTLKKEEKPMHNIVAHLRDGKREGEGRGGGAEGRDGKGKGEGRGCRQEGW